jgi:type 1 glutamine amidotransferase
VVLIRDLTDTMYDSKQWPNVNHFTGNSLVNEYIETYVCPTAVSTDFTGKKQFRFQEDKRPLIAFITAENEYSSNLTLPEFAHELLLKKGVNCEFAVGKPVYQGENIHNIENLQILEDADLAVFYIRRRALESGKMTMIRNYVNSGKPILGIRTASHSFDAKAKVLRPGTTELMDQWPEFDKDVLGGNYQDHYGSGKEIITVSVVPGMENHPVIKGISMDAFTSPSSLYKNRPLRSEKVSVLLLGTIPSKPSEPLMWINNTGKNTVIYCSLGSVDDWKNQSFRQLMDNSVSYLLNLK